MGKPPGRSTVTCMSPKHRGMRKSWQHAGVSQHVPAASDRLLVTIARCAFSFAALGLPPDRRGAVAVSACPPQALDPRRCAGGLRAALGADFVREGAAVSVGVDEQAVNERISAICARLAGGDGDSSSELIAALATVEMELHLFGDERSGDVGAARESVALGDHRGAAAILKQSFESAAPEPAPTRAPRVARQAAATDPAGPPATAGSLYKRRSRSGSRSRTRWPPKSTCRRTPARTSASSPPPGARDLGGNPSRPVGAGQG